MIDKILATSVTITADGTTSESQTICDAMVQCVDTILGDPESAASSLLAICIMFTAAYVGEPVTVVTGLTAAPAATTTTN